MFYPRRMTIRSRCSYIFKRSLLFCLLARFLPVWAGNLIETQPSDATICAWEISATFTVEGKDGHHLMYQWYHSGVLIPYEAAKGPSYTAQVAGSYYCEVRDMDTKEVEISNEVTLTINDVPYISGILAPSVCDHSELVANVDRIVVYGSDLLTYEWKLGGTTVDAGIVSNNAIPELHKHVTTAESGFPLTLTVTNGCGTKTSDNKPITVYAPPWPPTPHTRDYCHGEKAEPLSIGDSDEAVWYDSAIGGLIIPTPTPNTSIDGTQTWWVSQKHTWADGPTCEGDRSEATVTVRPLSDVPTFTALIEMCLNDPEITLDATGTSAIQWFDGGKNYLPIAPQINTSKPEEQIYYVTQTETGKCESPINEGKITVKVQNRASVDAVNLSYAQDLCPNNATVIDATSVNANSTFRWYAYSDKTGFIQNGSTFDTPVLMHDTAYYVTVQYGDLCESGYAKAAVITVRDIISPKIVFPDDIKVVVVPTDDGVCYATNVQTGFPFVSDNCTEYNNLFVYYKTDTDSIVCDNTHYTSPLTYQLGDATLEWWVKDEAGNKDYALQAISVRDWEKPRGTCPADITININENEYAAIVNYTLDYTDNCSVVIDSLNMGFHSGEEFPLGVTKVRHFLSDKAGNIETCEFNVIVQHPPRQMEVSLRPSAYQICPGQEVILTSAVSGGSGKYDYSWKPRPWAEAVMKDYPLTNTVYEVTVNDGITSETKSVTVTVLETQPVSLTLEGRRMDEIFEGDEVLVTATPGFSSYKLLLNHEVVQETGLNYGVSFEAELGTYFIGVFATDANYCVSQDQLQIDIESRKLPNVFTPNNDGKNDIFLEDMAEKSKELNKYFELQVFSRTGELLYKGFDGWDGKYKGKVMPQGTYLWVVKRIMNNGELRTLKGNVTLKL